MQNGSIQKSIGYTCGCIGTLCAIPGLVVSYEVGSGNVANPTLAIVSTALTTLSISLNFLGLTVLICQCQDRQQERTSLIDRNIDIYSDGGIDHHIQIQNILDFVKH